MSDSEENEVAIKVEEKERAWSTVLSTLVVSIMTFLMGCTLGYSSPVLLELESEEDPELRFDSVLAGLFGASSLVGGVFGGPIAGWVADKWGRKISLVLCGLPYLLGYFLIVLASVAATPIAFKALLLAGRFITGIGMGWLFLAAPVYIGEISSAKLRGVLGASVELSLTAGILFVYAIGLIPNFHYYHIALVLEGVVLLYMLLVVWIPESPRWLLVKNKEDWAMKVMVFLRGPKAESIIIREVEDIKSSILEAPHFTFLQSLKEFRRKYVLVPSILVLGVLLLQQLTGGGTTINAYAAPILKDAGVNNPDLIGAFAVGGAQFIATIFGAFLVDILGRKLLLIASAVGMFAAATMLGSHFYITRSCSNSTNSILLLVDNDCTSQYAPLAIVSLVLFVAAFAIGFGTVPWVIMSEYLPLRVRGVGLGIGVMCSLASSAFITGIYPIYADLVNPWFAWWTFSITNMIAIVFVAVFIVETKGKTLEDIQRHFEQKYSTKNASLPPLVPLASSEEKYDGVIDGETTEQKTPDTIFITPL